ncbi:Major facilitator, sugar transporter-like, partial [Dillenia turbinata]
GNAIGNGQVVLGDSSSSATATLYLSTMVAVCGSFGTGCSAGYSSQAESGIMEDLGLTVAEYSVFGSILTIGGMVGALPCGKVTDLLGRRGGAWLLDFGRLSVGIGNSMLSYVVPVYIAETSPKNLRGGFTILNQFVLVCGVTTVFLAGNLINWRLLALIGALPSVMQVLGLFFIPESPRWLAKIGQEKGCEEVLHRLRGDNADIAKEAEDIREYMKDLKGQPQAKFFDMFHMKYTYALIVGVGLMVMQQIGGANGVAFYASSIFTAAGFSSVVGTTAMAIIQVPSTGVGVFLMDRSGRRPLLIASAAGMCFGCLIVGTSFLFQDLQRWNDATPTLVFLGIMIYSAAGTLGVSGIPWAIMSEIFPINIKASAGSLVNMVSWFGSWIITYSFNFMMDWSATGTFFIFAGTSALGVLFVAKLVPETKGRTIEEIQQTMTSFTEGETF